MAAMLAYRPMERPIGPALALAALLATQAHAAGKEREFTHVLEPGKVHEECARLQPGEARRWSWTSDAPVDFNIHFHRGNDVGYPVKRDATKGESGTFEPDVAQDYCWMWTAKGARAKLTGRIGPK